MVDPKTKRHQRVALGNISVAAKKVPGVPEAPKEQ